MSGTRARRRCKPSRTTKWSSTIKIFIQPESSGQPCRYDHAALIVAIAGGQGPSERLDALLHAEQSEPRSIGGLRPAIVGYVDRNGVIGVQSHGDCDALRVAVTERVVEALLNDSVDLFVDRRTKAD